jgi:MoaA/NifB/PqqE/SkfB family radical SAM enzyme
MREREAAPVDEVAPLRMIWCELTGECQAECLHCHAGSGPGRGHGVMSAGDWEQVIAQAAGLGARRVVFIGGEPTLHPALHRLVRRALGSGLEAEVFTNMVRIPAVLWELFSEPGVSLATSWYSGDRAQHAAITGRDTWRQVRANVAEARRRGIPLRAGIIAGIVPGQQVTRAAAELRSIGVTDLGHDRLRRFGRGTIADPAQACGHCGRGVAAVLPDGSVTPCPMTRWLRAGNIRDTPLSTILGEPMAAVTGILPEARSACNPECSPNAPCTPKCNPNSSCNPYAALVRHASRRVSPTRSAGRCARLEHVSHE